MALTFVKMHSTPVYDRVYYYLRRTTHNHDRIFNI